MESNQELIMLLEEAIELSKVSIGIGYREMQSLIGSSMTKTFVKAFWNKDVQVILPDYTSCSIFLNGFTEKVFTRFILEHIKPGMTFLDVGAHIGYFSLLVSEIIGKDGQIHSFEPTKVTFESLQTNCSGRDNMTINNKAVFSKSGIMEFNDCGARFLSMNSIYDPRLHVKNLPKTMKTTKVNVQTITLDEYCKDIKPDFIKIDAEAAEFQILLGAEKTMENHRPVISCEDCCCDSDEKYKQLSEYMVDKNYNLLTTVDNNLIFVPQG